MLRLSTFLPILLSLIINDIPLSYFFASFFWRYFPHSFTSNCQCQFCTIGHTTDQYWDVNNWWCVYLVLRHSPEILNYRSTISNSAHHAHWTGATVIGTVVQDGDINTLDINEDSGINILDIDEVPLNQLKHHHRSRTKTSRNTTRVHRMMNGII